MYLLKTYFHDLLGLAYPRSCAGCNQPLVTEENQICLDCLLELPRTGYQERGDNPVVQSFMGRSKVIKAASFLHFQKGGKVQSMMHQFKYQNRPAVGKYLANLAALEWRKFGFFDDVDYLVPVPLHAVKLKKRGYNQAEVIANGLGSLSKVEVCSGNLLRKHYNETQTMKARFERWLNVKSVFEVQDPDIFINCHVMLVDDVLTTGSTLEGCLKELQKIPGIQLSVFTLAYAR